MQADRFWAGLSSDMVIEQVLMRSVKSPGGLTHGRGMAESQRANGFCLCQHALALVPPCRNLRAGVMRQVVSTKK